MKTPNRTNPTIRLIFPIALALLLILAFCGGLSGVTPASADPGTLYVDGASGSDTPACGSAAAPCQTLSHTLHTRATEGDTVLVAAGTYTENLTISGITITLRGGYTLSGTLWLSDTGATTIHGNNADRVFAIHNSNAVLENLTITGGTAPITQCWGSGVWVTNGSVTIRNSVITKNTSDCGGAGIEVNDDFGPAHLTLENSTISYNTGDESGGLQVWGGNASALVEHVTFTGNTAGNSGGGINVVSGATAIINYCLIHANTATGWGGGGISVDGASLEVNGTTISGNNAPNGQSGGINLGSNSIVNVWSSILANNTAHDHGGAAALSPNSTLNLINALITGNTAATGNANALAVNGNATIINSTLSDNNPQAAQAILLWSGHLTITNSILWNNALNLQADPPCSTCFTVTYTNIEGGWAGTGNLNQDPHFIGGGNYRLQPASPCVDAGTNNGAPPHDLEWTPRPQDGNLDGSAITDMGTYELLLRWVYLPLTTR